MIKSKILYVISFGLLFTSCDPPHYINFINTTKTNAKVKINLESHRAETAFSEIAIGDSIVFNLQSKDTANINFGIGTWGDEEIHEIVKDIKDLEIETSEIKTIYKTQESIKALLIENRKGFRSGWETEIRIEIK